MPNSRQFLSVWRADLTSIPTYRYEVISLSEDLELIVQTNDSSLIFAWDLTCNRALHFSLAKFDHPARQIRTTVVLRTRRKVSQGEMFPVFIAKCAVAVGSEEDSTWGFI